MDPREERFMMRAPGAGARPRAARTSAPLWVTVAFAAAAAALSAGLATAETHATAAGEIPYRLGSETVPNGAFDRVGPKWQQLRPDEGEKLAVIPEGWLAGYQGGERRMPIPGVDPDTHDRCMVFLYGAGRVDIFAPAFPLDGPGTYLLSIRTRSVLNPTDRALRVVLRLLPAPEAPSGSREVALDRIVGAGPQERFWRKWTSLVEVPPGLARAELHLIKEDPMADFLVDDVSLRRIEAAPEEVLLELPPAAGTYISPVVYLGAVQSAAIEITGLDRSETAESRTGARAEPGPAWEAWRRVGAGADPAGRLAGDLHLFGRGIGLYAQIRVRPLESAAPATPRERRVLLRTVPATRIVAAQDVVLTAMIGDPEGDDEGWRSLTLPDATACTEGPLVPLRALALEATRGIEGDLARALALREALRSWAPFTAGGEPPRGSPDPTPGDLLTDCRRSTPLHCGAWRADLITAACWCTGLVCRAASSRAAGDATGWIDGIEAWDGDAGRWAFLTLDPGSPPTGPGGVPAAREPDRAPGGDAPPRSALELAGGRPVALALDLRWGRRGWLVHDVSRGVTDVPESPEWIARSRGEIEFPVNVAHAVLEATGARSFEVRLSHSMPAFSHYIYRLSPAAPWKRVAGPLFWKLTPGENLLEIHPVNAMGFSGSLLALRARAGPDRVGAAAAYAGMRALSGDPHVHTGLGIYGLLDPKRPLATGTPEEAFASAIGNGLDWAAVTDYSGNIDDPRTLEWRLKKGAMLRNPDGTETDSEWKHLEAVVGDADRPGRFAAFLGVEFDGEGYTAKGGTGRKIILLPDASVPTYCSPRVENVGDCPVVEDAYRYTRDHGGVMIAVSPCPAAGGEDTDWSRHDPAVALMELSGGVCEHAPGGLLDVVVRRGLSVGVAGGGDSREGIAGGSDRTICWASEVGRAAILEAIRSRRCYWSAAGHLDLAFTLNAAPIGSEIPSGDLTVWSLSAESRSTPAFGSAEILRDGEVVASAPCESATRCALEGGIGEGWPGVYYAAINSPDGARLAVTSPIRVVPGKGR